MCEPAPIYIGINLPARQGVSNQQIVDTALTQGYDLITSRITSRTYRKRVQARYATSDLNCDVPVPIGEDLVVFPGSHVSNTIALCAPWVELDSKDTKVADVSLKVLQREMEYARFCGLPYIVIEGPKRRTYLARYAHALAKILAQFPDLKIMLHTAFTEDFREGQAPLEIMSTWDVWDGVRVMCGHPLNLGLALEVKRSRLPEYVVSRWLCEPVMMLILSEANAFVPNPKNYPVLPRHTQQVVHRFSSLRPFFLIKENLGPDKLIDFNGGDDACRIYLRNLLSTQSFRSSQDSQISRTSRNVDAEISSLTGHISGVTELSGDDLDYSYNVYADILETPLQPLSKPLDSNVYEVFESDKAKYNQYFNAISLSIKDLCHSRFETQVSSEPFIIAVLGAGRGSLVDKVLDAIVVNRIISNRPVKIYAVEKHAGPVAYMHARKASERVWEPVVIVHDDMRNWVPKEPVHLIVSELLGSFGDNELSPECLGALARNPKVLAPNGIVIPTSYSSFVAPVFCPQLWNKARDYSKTGLEQPYVICLHQAERLVDVPQLAWSFSHDNRQSETEYTRCNIRQAKLSFQNQQRSRIYGFAGYFQATLYSDVTLSTLPSSRTPKLKSWFPMYFPLKEPLDVVPDSIIDISLWRELDQTRCWYEWTVETSFKRQRVGVTIIHNFNGHAQSVLLN